MPGIPRIGLEVVDVRDIVDVHLRAMTAQAAAVERFLAIPLANSENGTVQGAVATWWTRKSLPTKRQVATAPCTVPIRQRYPERYCWRTPSAPEARGTLAGGGAKRNHRKRHNRATRPERAPDPGCFCREFWSVAPPGREKSLLVCPGGCAALRHRLISVAPPGREIASLSSPAVSLATGELMLLSDM